MAEKTSGLTMAKWRANEPKSGSNTPSMMRKDKGARATLPAWIRFLLPDFAPSTMTFTIHTNVKGMIEMNASWLTEPKRRSSSGKARRKKVIVALSACSRALSEAMTASMTVRDPSAPTSRFSLTVARAKSRVAPSAIWKVSASAI